MNYYWTECPGCGSQITIQTTAYPDRVSGSLRRWSHDRSINDGRQFTISAEQRGAGGALALECVCGQPIVISGSPSAVAEGRI